MKIYNNPEKELWPSLCLRPSQDLPELEKQVNRIIKQVRKSGDRSLKSLTRKLDHVSLRKLRVSDDEIKTSEKLVDEELKLAITEASKNIEKFHAAQKLDMPVVETMPGISCWRKSVAIEKVGLYIPGGSAPLFSTVLMLGIPAKIAGCREIILCTPPQKDGSIHPAILYAASVCGIQSIYKVGGAQAVAAMAYGTESIPRVFKIFGPGNSYVTMAKQLVQQDCAVDMPAGPSEVLVIADVTADPAFVAADLLSQAEHGPDSQVILLTNSTSVVNQVKTEIELQLPALARIEIATQALSNSRCLVFENVDLAISFSNMYAPEHLILACEDAETLSQKVSCAGSVFIGNYSPESAGDYASGTNHTLPTNGYASMYSGVSLDSFVKKISFQQLTKDGLQRISKTVMTMAAAEGLEAHRRAVAIRLNS